MESTPTHNHFNSFSPKINLKLNFMFLTFCDFYDESRDKEKKTLNLVIVIVLLPFSISSRNPMKISVRFKLQKRKHQNIENKKNHLNNNYYADNSSWQIKVCRELQFYSQLLMHKNINLVVKLKLILLPFFLLLLQIIRCKCVFTVSTVSLTLRFEGTSTTAL